MKKTLAFLFAVLFIFSAVVSSGIESYALAIGGLRDLEDDTIGGYLYTLISSLFILSSKEQYVQWIDGTVKATAIDDEYDIVDIYDVDKLEQARDLLKDMKFYGITLNGEKLGQLEKQTLKMEIGINLDSFSLDLIFYEAYETGKTTVSCCCYLPGNEYYADLQKGIAYYCRQTYINFAEETKIKLYDGIKGEEHEVEAVRRDNGEVLFIYDNCVMSIRFDADKELELLGQVGIYDYFAEETPIIDEPSSVDPEESSCEVDLSNDVSKDELSADIGDNITSDGTGEESTLIESSANTKGQDEGNKYMLAAILSTVGMLAVWAIVLCVILKARKKQDKR